MLDFYIIIILRYSTISKYIHQYLVRFCEKFVILRND